MLSVSVQVRPEDSQASISMKGIYMGNIFLIAQSFGKRQDI